MCGIAGISKLNQTTVDINEINILVEALKHRGPDGKGTWVSKEKDIALGHTRLSILDLSLAGKQPMGYLNGRYYITLNGEIYNFIEIREQLKKRDYSFQTDTDTEVILAAYHEWGQNMLSKFNGMWAFAIYDTQDNTLFLTRDRFGVKPFYYFLDDQRLIFASEVQAIHKVLGNNHPLDDLIIKDIAKGSFENHGTNRTYLKDVKSLPPGFSLFLKNRNIEIKQWYNLRQTPISSNFKKQAEELKSLIIDSCRLRLRSDVSIGTCLSGGLDSGSITAIISNFSLSNDKRFNNYSHRGFCASFPNTPIDEKKEAKKLADQIGSNLDIIDVTPPSCEELELAMEQCDGPMHALAFFPIWKLYRYIKSQGITVTLDGQGPDEMLGGYRPVYEAMQAAIQLKKPFWFYDVYKTYAAQGETNQFSSIQYAKTAKKYVIRSYAKKLFNKISANFKRNTVTPPSTLAKSDANLTPCILNKNFKNTLDKSLFTQFFQNPLPGILNQYDRCSMAHGVECRMPFMDYRIVEYIFSLPVNSKIGGGYTKRILREAMKDILPDETRLNKRKIGFNAPIVDWFKGPLKNYMLKIMNSEAFLTSKYFDGEKVHENFLHFLQSENSDWDTAWQFWPPVHLTWWLKKQNIQ